MPLWIQDILVGGADVALLWIMVRAIAGQLRRERENDE